jgi:NADH dehydrogenase
MARPRIVIIGAGFAGFHAARELCRLARAQAEVVIINPTDYFLYLPLLPEVSAALLDPRDISVSLASVLPRARLVLAEASGVDLAQRLVHYTDAEGRPGTIGYHQLVVAVGSVNKLLPVPGVAEHAHGFRSIPEALYLRDHMTRQIELADATDDPGERAARTTFVVAGAGYTGTEVAAHGVLYTDVLYARHPRLRDHKPRWMLIDIADRVLPELDPRLSVAADAVLRKRGVDVRTGTSVAEAMEMGVLLSDGTRVPSRSLIWCVGVRPDPLVADFGLQTRSGRLLVDEYLSVPGWPGVHAVGDAAAVPDLTRPGEITPMTAQHAQRQGKRVARNIAAGYGLGQRRPYRHADLGFLVDLGGTQAAANPLHVPVSGLPAKAITRAYHLLAMPGNRLRTSTQWLLDALLPRQTVQLGLVRAPAVPLDTARPELPQLVHVPPHGETRR